MSGRWMTADQVAAEAQRAPTECPQSARHEPISPTMPFCRNCGGVMPAAPADRTIASITRELDDDELLQGRDRQQAREMVDEDDEWPIGLVQG